jgi:hypothetical protein
MVCSKYRKEKRAVVLHHSKALQMTLEILKYLSIRVVITNNDARVVQTLIVTARNQGA